MPLLILGATYSMITKTLWQGIQNERDSKGPTNASTTPSTATKAMSIRHGNNRDTGEFVDYEQDWGQVETFVFLLYYRRTHYFIHSQGSCNQKLHFITINRTLSLLDDITFYDERNWLRFFTQIQLLRFYRYNIHIGRDWNSIMMV